MRTSNQSVVRHSILTFVLLVFTLTLFAQSAIDEAYKKAKAEIEATFGFFPLVFDSYPEIALAGAWDAFKVLTGHGTNIDPKNKELIMLAVASQIPYQFCIYYHNESAKAQGATEQEIQEAIALGGLIRQWSMVIQGNQVDLEKFKEEFHRMMNYASKHSK